MSMEKSKWMLRAAAAGTAVMLLAAACAPGAVTSMAVGTEPLGTEPVGTAIVSSPVPSVEATSDLNTAMPTEGTAVGTAESTAVGTMEATEAATMEATAQTTQMPNTTGTPVANEQPAVLLSTELIGSQVIDASGVEVGTVQELLIDNTGAVQYVIVDAEDYLDTNAGGNVTSTQAADNTPAASETQTGETPMPTADMNATDDMATGWVAVPLADFMVNQAGMDNEDQVLVYQGMATDLSSLGSFDATLLDGDGFLINSADSDVAANITYDGLIRVSKYGDFDLKNADGDDLGEVEDLIVDVPQGKVTYGVVDFGGFLGIGEQSTAVPWDMFTVQTTSDETNLMLDITADALENAPTIALGDWPSWPERVEGQGDWTTDWDAQIRTFWNGAASS